MKLKEYDFRDGDIRKKILDLLRGKVFHVTKYSAYQSILKSDAIETNVDGRFGYTYSMSSTGRKADCVCFFDLRNKTQKVIDRSINGLDFMDSRIFGEKIVYLFLVSDFHEELISPRKIQATFPGRYIPDVEMLHEGFVPLRKIEKSIVVYV
ncbi:hypothetical protein MNBD_DELTA01-1484 [hydrothermal vent metagenome]|uniref:Uncharacterized protein n=1 Tax=hydrothermal vent metagenome TaxID=652676 RepID=A0A3B0R5V3_9ZZZZ